MPANAAGHVKFSACNAWLDSVLSDGGEAALEIDAPKIDNNNLSWLLAFLSHEAIKSRNSYEVRAKSLANRFKDSALEARLKSIKSSRSISELAKNSSKILGTSPIERRRGGIIIKTPNYFTNQFTPPSVEDMRRALNRLFASREQNAMLQNSFEKSLGYAIVFYAAALTLHPYQDGNGRTFRLLFASDVAYSDHQSSNYWILILAVLRSVFAGQFHLAMKIFRLGDVNMLFDLIRAAQDATFQIFPKDAALTDATDSARYFLSCYEVFEYRAKSAQL